MFSDIKVLIWDFDGTFYHLTSQLTSEIRESEYKVIENHTGWPREKVLAEFNQVFKVITPSGTQTAAMISHISTSQAALEGEKYIDRGKYLKHDDKLIELFTKLINYQHYMLVNGVKENVQKSLSILGIPVNIFKEIVTAATVGENKPSDKGFRYILNKTQLPPEQHLMIGDRVEVDLTPAKKVGMKTCLVWSQSDPELNRGIDLSLPTVYDVAEAIL